MNMIVYSVAHHAMCTVVSDIDTAFRYSFEEKNCADVIQSVEFTEEEIYSIEDYLPIELPRSKYARYITWMDACARHFDCEDATVHLAIDIFKRFRDVFPKRKLVFAAIIIASKWYDEVGLCSLDLIEYYVTATTNKTEIASIERHILQAMDFRLATQFTLFNELQNTLFTYGLYDNDDLVRICSYLLMLSGCLRPVHITLDSLIATAYYIWEQIDESTIMASKASEDLSVRFDTSGFSDSISDDFESTHSALLSAEIEPDMMIRLEQIHFAYNRAPEYDIIFMLKTDHE